MEPTTADRIDRALKGKRDIIDITTTGRTSGEPRRLEIVFHNLDGRIFISGMPNPRRRSWLANLETDPRSTFHLKRTVAADLPARARIITDEPERRAVLAEIIRTAWHGQDLEAMVRYSPLIEVEFDRRAA